MLSNEITVKNGMVRRKTVDAVRPGLVEVGKTLFYHGREGVVVSVRGSRIVLDIDGEEYIVDAEDCESGTTGDSMSKTMDIEGERTLSHYKGYMISTNGNKFQATNTARQIDAFSKEELYRKVDDIEEKLAKMREINRRNADSKTKDQDPIVTPQEVNLMSKEEVVNYIHYTTEALKDDGWGNAAIRRLFERADQFKRGETK